MKGSGMLIVSLRGINQGFWSSFEDLSVEDETPRFLAVKVSSRVVKGGTRRNDNKRSTLFPFFKTLSFSRVRSSLLARAVFLNSG